MALADSAGITADSAERTDPAYRAATAALAARRPWLADSLLAPALADSARRTPWVVLLAAEAAAASGRWERVDTLLADVQPASDARAATAARLLLARASLERGDAAAALAHARQARELATLPRSRGEALALLARARERLGMRDGARTAYDSAAAMLPPVGDWLALRAAALTPGRAERSRAYDRLHLPAARERAAYVEAQILEHTGRPRDAIPLYESVGASHHAMRLRAATARGTTERTRARRELVAFIRARAGSPSARQAIEMLDEGRYALSAEEELIVARSAAVHGPLSRARAGLARAFRQRPPTDAERLFQASVLARSGASGRREAARVLARIAASSPYAGRAALERALLLRAGGRREAARGALRAIVRRYPRDTTAAAGALLALAEMATDAKRDAEARDSYLAVARRYPTSAHAPAARFQAAILAFAAGRHAIAAAELDSLVALYPLAREVTPARYWSGRARAARGDSDSARERWGMLLAADSTSYYAALAARRLGAAPWVPPEHPDRFAALPDVEDALARVELLERLGMGLEARLEMESLAASADSSAERLLAVANAFRARGQTRRAMELGRRVIALGAADARAWRLVYPVDAADLVASQAAAREVDPALVAAVIRQESSFDRWATSEAGARGLMQVMPRVAQALARAERIAPWSAARLYEPEVNVRLGVLHLRSFTGHYGHPALALAAYNAGPGRVARWSSRAGGKDPELFVERIRFAETRGYVQTVLWSRDLYAALYDWSPARAAD
ncbi:MAG TPA: lytic transglycosylase domain-containing protein [Gemmatimonadaceae bacterium]|nr:lytic transglycosylase domain-containing protein [Gemmatimonadaceae bacterium]